MGDGKSQEHGGQTVVVELAVLVVEQDGVGQRGEPGMADARHSADFWHVRWYGTDYSFTGRQARYVNLLWHEWENGTAGLSDAYALEQIEPDADSRVKLLRDLFPKHPAWETMIVECDRRGAHRLAPPKQKSEIPT